MAGPWIIVEMDAYSAGAVVMDAWDGRAGRRRDDGAGVGDRVASRLPRCKGQVRLWIPWPLPAVKNAS